MWALVVYPLSRFQVCHRVLLRCWVHSTQVAALHCPAVPCCAAAFQCASILCNRNSALLTSVTPFLTFRNSQSLLWELTSLVLECKWGCELFVVLSWFSLRCPPGSSRLLSVMEWGSFPPAPSHTGLELAVYSKLLASSQSSCLSFPRTRIIGIAIKTNWLIFSFQITGSQPF